ncbi:MAG: two-component regulator propeller domain-containing protein, partial [Bacteroidota bacterium]
MRITHPFSVLSLLVLLLIVPFYGRSQSLTLKNYTVENGLPSNFIYNIIQDHKGFIWISSEAGISRFDGQSFTNFTPENGLPDGEILKLFEDSRGIIWFVALNGRVGTICDGKIDRQEKLNANIGDKIVSVNEDWDHHMVFLGMLKGVVRFHNGKYVAISSTPVDALSKNFPTFQFSNSAIIDAKKKEIVAMTRLRQTDVFRGNKSYIAQVDTGDWSTRNFINPIYFSRSGGPYNTRSLGILKLNPDYSSSTIINDSQLLHRACLSFLIDKEGIVQHQVVNNL